MTREAALVVSGAGTGAPLPRAKRPVRSWPGPGQCPHQVAMTAGDAVIMAYVPARDCAGDAPSQRQLGAQFGVSRARVAALVSPLSGTPGAAAASPARCRQKVQAGARTR